MIRKGEPSCRNSRKQQKKSRLQNSQFSKHFAKSKRAGFVLVRGRRYTQNWKLTPCETTHLCEEEGQKTTETALMLRTALLIYQCQCTDCLLCGMTPSNHVPRGRDQAYPNCALQLLNNFWCLEQLFAVLATSSKFCLSEQFLREILVQSTYQARKSQGFRGKPQFMRIS